MPTITVFQKGPYLSIKNSSGATIGRLQQRPFETPETSKEWLFLATTLISISLEELQAIADHIRELKGINK